MICFKYAPLVPRCGNAIDDVLHQVETVQVVLHPHVEGCRDRALFLIAADMQVRGSCAGMSVGGRARVSMETEDDVLVFGEKRVVFRFSSRPWGCSVETAASSDRRR